VRFYVCTLHTVGLLQKVITVYKMLISACFSQIFYKVAYWSDRPVKTCYTREKISHRVNKMCSHCLFPLVDESGTSCYHLATMLTRPTDSQQVIPTSLISSARNKLLTSWYQQARSNLLQKSCIIFVGTTCSKTVAVINVINLVTRW
jgi:hypothetical protein